MQESSKEKREEILTVWLRGGTHAHNIVAASLRSLAGTDEDAAKEIYAELRDKHNY